MKTVKIILYVLAGVGIVYGGVQLYRQLHAFKTKEAAVTYLIHKDGSKDASLLMSFDSEFVINWANGLFKKEMFFFSKGKKYMVSNGRATVA